MDKWCEGRQAARPGQVRVQADAVSRGTHQEAVEPDLGIGCKLWHLLQVEHEENVLQTNSDGQQEEFS
jgi:hypothetical protein